MATPTTKKTNSKQISRRKKGVIRAKSDFFRTARYGLTLQEHRVIYYAILKGQQDGTPFEPVELAVKDFKELCGLKGESSYSTVRNVSKKIAGRVVEVAYKDTDGPHLLQAAWLTSVKYHVKEGKVTITPNKVLQPYFEGKPFTDTEFYFLIKFTSQYAERLYELLKTFEYKPLIDFDVDDLRARLAVPSTQYKNFNMFRTRVLEPAIEDINTYTDINVSMKEKRGLHNKVEVVFFMVKKKPLPKLADRVERGEFRPPLSAEEQELFWQELLDEDELENEPIPGQLMLDGSEVK